MPLSAPGRARVRPHRTSRQRWVMEVLMPAPGRGRAASSPAEPGASSDLPAAVDGDHAAQNGLDPGLGETGLGDHRPEGFHIGEIGRATSELQSLMRISYAVFCLKKKNHNKQAHS